MSLGGIPQGANSDNTALQVARNQLDERPEERDLEPERWDESFENEISTELGKLQAPGTFKVPPPASAPAPPPAEPGHRAPNGE